MAATTSGPNEGVVSLTAGQGRQPCGAGSRRPTVGQPRLTGATASVSLPAVNGPVVRVGVLGCGTVGSSLIPLLQQRRDVVAARTGLELDIVRVAVRDLSRPRPVELPAAVFTDDPEGVVKDPEVDVVVELMGGIEPARSLLLTALEAGKPVVTANKALLASHGPELFAAADDAGVDLLFEAAVAGGIPIVRPLRESLRGEPVQRVLGIVNGTTNFVLTRMAEEGVDYDDALAEAQEMGFAEADPTADVDGHDAAAKLALVASIAFGAQVTADDVTTEGIAAVSAADIAFAGRNGFVVKLLADAELHHTAGGPELSLVVGPALVPDTHPLAAVRDSFNAIFVQGGAVGELMFYGRGAGGDPTASAVLGDLVDAASNLSAGSHGSMGRLASVRIRAPEEARSAFHVSIEAADRLGVLAAVAGVFGEHNVSIASMEQESRDDADVELAAGRARLDFVTHVARAGDFNDTLDALRGLEVVREVGHATAVLSDEPGDDR